jgi:hypothetical protein
MLTTIDNPHDPFDDFFAWYTFDVMSGYNTAEFLSRITVDSDELSEADHDRAVELAIDEIMELNVTGVYRKVVQEIDDND